MLLAFKKVVLSDRLQLNCSFPAATLQHLKVSNGAAKLLPRASNAAQPFCIPLQLELSCCLASKVLLSSCNWAVKLFWSDFVALSSTASFVRVQSNLTRLLPPLYNGFFFVHRQKIHAYWLLFKTFQQRPPLYSGFFLLSPRWPL